MNQASLITALVNAKTQAQSSTQKSGITITHVIIGAAVIAGGVWAYNKYKKTIQIDANKDVADTSKPGASSAQVLRSAMNQSGNEWMMSFDGTDSETILSEAKNIADLAAVQKYYRDMFDGDELLTDLRGELSTEDYNKFIDLVSKNKTIKQADGTLIVDKASQTYPLFFVANKATKLYKKTWYGIGSFQSVNFGGVLPFGMMNTQINSNTVRDNSNPITAIAGGNYYRTFQTVKGQKVEVYVPKQDFTLLGEWTMNQGITKGTYKKILIDENEF